ncbi:MAG: glycosyltransferase [Lachnospiraceae bacterium]|nr:glycosyltransferase [Lachnospiraceae bacterium]
MDIRGIVNLISNGNTEEAAERVSILKQEDPSDVRAWIMDATICEATGDIESEKASIAEGMRCDPRNHELFYMLGLILIHTNLNQAYLCFEQALHYCSDAEDKKEITARLAELKKQPSLSVRPVSVVIVSYNDRELLQKNITTFRTDMPKDAYEIIVVDNHSDDGVEKWLRLQSDLRLIENGENVGFPVAANIGVRAARERNDIFLINNDCIPATNAVFWLRMGLYEDRNVGAVSGISNNASAQTDPDAPSSIEACMTYGEKKNIPMRFPYETRCRFTGFAILLKREAVDAVTEKKDLLDPAFSPAYFEDDDLGMRVALAGFRQLLCHNAFLYHRGGDGFMSLAKQESLTRSRDTFMEKWGFDIWAYTETWDELVDSVDAERDRPVRVLELFCGMGVNLSAIRYRHPHAFVAGVEPYAQIAGLGRTMGDIIGGMPETVQFPWPEASFDYILASDALERAADPVALLNKLKSYLKEDGVIVHTAPEDERMSDLMRHVASTCGFTKREVVWNLVRLGL